MKHKGNYANATEVSTGNMFIVCMSGEKSVFSVMIERLSGNEMMF